MAFAACGVGNVPKAGAQRIGEPVMADISESTSVQAVPAQWLAQGFRLLTLREFRNVAAPPAFAWIEQRLLRSPQRVGRHGVFFANTFRPEVMAWLTEQLGRPSVRDDAGQPQRNALWPAMTWHGEDRTWPDGTITVEWFVDVTFPHETSWAAFRERWHVRLMGEDDGLSPMTEGGDAFAAPTN